MRKEMTVGDLKKILELYPDEYLVTYDSAYGKFYTDEHHESTTDDEQKTVVLNE